MWMSACTRMLLTTDTPKHLRREVCGLSAGECIRMGYGSRMEQSRMNTAGKQGRPRRGNWSAVQTGDWRCYPGTAWRGLLPGA